MELDEKLQSCPLEDDKILPRLVKTFLGAPTPPVASHTVSGPPPSLSTYRVVKLCAMKKKIKLASELRSLSSSMGESAELECEEVSFDENFDDFVPSTALKKEVQELKSIRQQRRGVRHEYDLRTPFLLLHSICCYQLPITSDFYIQWSHEQLKCLLETCIEEVNPVENV
ncbi:hypothetical protein LXL04_028214 [Taraxacum kok-saghyz]